MPKFRSRSANLQVGVSADGKRALARFDRGVYIADDATAAKLRDHPGFGRTFVEIDEGRERSAAGTAARNGAGRKKRKQEPATDGGAGSEAGG